MAYDYAYMEGYELQPTKSVALNIKAKPNKRSLNTSVSYSQSNVCCL
jgi:hypothetical protein